MSNPKNDLRLKIGNIEFTDFEAPQVINSFGGYQSMAIHDFYGGYRTVQAFGAFPKEIIWDGILINQNGKTAMQRALEIDTIRINGTMQPLTIGPYNLNVVVKEFLHKPNLEQWVPYSITIIPVQDLTGANSKPVSQVPQDAQLSQQLQNINQIFSNPQGTYQYSATVTDNMNTLNSSINNLMQTNQGSLSSLNATSKGFLTGQITEIQSGLEADMTSTDPATSLSSTNLYNSLEQFSNILAGNNNLAVINTVNPDLPLLASTYYGDPTKWSVIAQANNLVDPMPIGNFGLTIPSLSNVDLTNPLFN